MDFKRVKLIFIVTFLLLNIFLLNVYLQKREHASPSSPTNTFNIVEQLAKANVVLPKDIATDVTPLPTIVGSVLPDTFATRSQLTNQTATVNSSGELVSTFTTPTTLKMSSGTLEGEDYDTLTRLLSDSTMIMYGSDYRFFTHLANDNQIIYTQQVNGAAIVDGTAQITFHLSGTNIVGYTQTYLTNPTSQGQVRDDIVSKEEALKSIYLEHGIPNEAIIKRFERIYAQTHRIDNLSVYGQVWYVEIVLKDGSTVFRRVDAQTGKVLNNRPKSGSEPTPSQSE